MSGGIDLAGQVQQFLLNEEALTKEIFCARRDAFFSKNPGFSWDVINALAIGAEQLIEQIKPETPPLDDRLSWLAQHHDGLRAILQVAVGVKNLLTMVTQFPELAVSPFSVLACIAYEDDGCTKILAVPDGVQTLITHALRSAREHGALACLARHPKGRAAILAVEGSVQILMDVAKSKPSPDVFNLLIKLAEHPEGRTAILAEGNLQNLWELVKTHFSPWDHRRSKILEGLSAIGPIKSVATPRSALVVLPLFGGTNIRGVPNLSYCDVPWGSARK